MASAASNGAVAQELKKTSSEGEGLITYEMLVSKHNFPVKQHTGNPEKDQQVYAAAKNKWVAQNRELYNRYNNQGEAGNPELRKSQQPLLSPAN